MAWFLLIIAGLLEVGWAIGLKYTNGFTNPMPTFLTLFGIFLSMFFLARATQTIPVSTAYAVWVGIGIVGTSLGGVLILKENLPPLKIFFIILLVTSLVGLKVTTGKT